MSTSLAVTTRVRLVVLGGINSDRFCRSVVSFYVSSSVFSFMFSPVLGFNSFIISSWDSMRRLLISEVISSFKEALKLSRRLFSILGDFGLEEPAMPTSWSKKQEFSTTIGETRPSLTRPVLTCRLFFLFWLLVVDIMDDEIQFKFSILNCVSTKLRIRLRIEKS